MTVLSTLTTLTVRCSNNKSTLDETEDEREEKEVEEERGYDEKKQLE